MVKTAALAEQYFASDPPGALSKLRRFGELVAQATAAEADVSVGRSVRQIDLLRRLGDRGVLEPELLLLFDGLRLIGNTAVHEDSGSSEDALQQLRIAHELAVWFYRAYIDGDFKPSPFKTPSKETREDLRRDLQTIETQLAEERQAYEDKLAALQAELRAKLGPKELEDRLAAARRATKRIELSEEQTRELIDRQLRAAGWEVDTRKLRHGKGARPARNRNRAIAEWPTATGPADYVLFCGLRPVGIIEAKRETTGKSKQEAELRSLHPAELPPMAGRERELAMLADALLR
ncbi:MAG: hypothetical protein KC457_32220, partial [Myxococcales bacterium]|nr:hypothetical protein [Myxococcales bacterium]